MAEFTIRRAGEGDLSEVLRLLRQLWPDKPLDSAEYEPIYRKCLEDEGLRFFIVESAGAAIGFTSIAIRNSIWAKGKIAHIDELVVNEESRSGGVGGAVLAELEKIMRQEGCVRLEVDTMMDRRRAHEFYRRHGFEERAYIFTKKLS